MPFDFINSVLTSVLSFCKPKKVILYNVKYAVGNQEAKSASLCLIFSGCDIHELQKKLYLHVSASIPIEFLLYPLAEWEALLQNPLSFASQIEEKGTVLYEKP